MYPTAQRHLPPVIPPIFLIAATFLIAALGVTLTMAPASAVNVTSPASLGITANDQAASNRIEVRAVAHRGGAAVGRHGGAVVHRGGAVVGPREIGRASCRERVSPYV